MKSVLALSLLLFSVQIVLGQKCVEPRIGMERGRCAQLTVEFSDTKRTSQLTGVVIDANGAPVPHSVIEVYSPYEKGEIVATYQSDETGRFCIKGLKKGKYRMKVGWSGFGFNCAEMKIEISGKTKRHITVPLEVGH